MHEALQQKRAESRQARLNRQQMRNAEYFKHLRTRDDIRNAAIFLASRAEQLGFTITMDGGVPSNIDIMGDGYGCDGYFQDGYNCRPYGYQDGYNCRNGYGC